MVDLSWVKPLADGTGDIRPNWGFFPFMDTLKSIVSGTEAVMLLVCVVAVLLATGGWILGKVSQNSGLARISGFVIVAAVIAAVIVASAGPLVDWASTTIQLT